MRREEEWDKGGGRVVDKGRGAQSAAGIPSVRWQNRADQCWGDIRRLQACQLGEYVRHTLLSAGQWLFYRSRHKAGRCGHSTSRSPQTAPLAVKQLWGPGPIVQAPLIAAWAVGLPPPSCCLLGNARVTTAALCCVPYLYRSERPVFLYLCAPVCVYLCSPHVETQTWTPLMLSATVAACPPQHSPTTPRRRGTPSCPWTHAAWYVAKEGGFLCVPQDWLLPHRG